MDAQGSRLTKARWPYGCVKKERLPRRAAAPREVLKPRSSPPSMTRWTNSYSQAETRTRPFCG